METERLIDKLEDDVNELIPLFYICEFHGFIPTVTDYDSNLLGVSGDCCCIELENYPTPAGEDWIVAFWFDGTAKGFKRAIEQYAFYFDIDDEVSLYVDNRGKNGIPSSIEVLLEDVKYKMRELEDLAEELNNKQTKPKETSPTAKASFVVMDDVESLKEPPSWLLDGVTMCCGYDFGLDVSIESVKYCPICGRALFRKPKEK